MFSLTSFFGETASVVEKKVKAKNPSTLFSAGYEIFMALLSLLSIFNMILLFFIRDPSLGAVLALVNFVLIIFFIADFLARLIKSPSKSEYFCVNMGGPIFCPVCPSRRRTCSAFSA